MSINDAFDEDATFAAGASPVPELRQASRLQELAKASLAIAAASSLEEALQLIADHARAIIGAHLCMTARIRGTDWSQAIAAFSLSDKYAAWRGRAAKPDGSGIHAELCRTNRPARMTQAELTAHRTWRCFGRHADEHPPPCGWLAAPLVGKDGRNLGLIQLSDRQAGEFTEADEAALVQLAQFGSAVIERAETEQALRDRNTRLALLFDTAASLLSASDPDGVVESLFHAVAGQLGLDVSFNFAVAEDGGSLYLDSCVGVGDAVARSLARLEFGQAVCGTVAQRKQPMYVEDVQSSDDPLTDLIRRLGIRAYACNPLLCDGRLLGTLSFGTRRRDRFSEEDLSFFRTVSHYVAVVKERRRAELALRESERRARDQLIELEALYEAAPIGLALLSPDLRYLRVNAPLAEMNGIPVGAHIGRTVQEVVPDIAHAAAPLFQRVMDGREPALGLELQGETAARPGAERVWRENVFPLNAADGTVLGIGVTVQDVTEEKRTEERHRLLMAELNHRVKNSLAVVQSMAAQTLRHSTSLDGFAEAFTGRLRAHAAANGLLTQSQWRSADLKALVKQALKAHGRGSGQVTLSGPAVALPPKQVVALGLVLHELATNAAKYGALSVPAGRLEIVWSVENGGTEGADRPRIAISWIERDGPPVTPPASAGFGTILIRHMASYDLEGKAKLCYEPDGLHCRIAFPRAQQTGEEASGATAA